MRLTLELAFETIRSSNVSLRSIHEVAHISSYTGIDHHLTTWMLAEVTSKIDNIVVVQSQFSSLLDLLCELVHGHCFLDLVQAKRLVSASVLHEDSVEYLHDNDDDKVNDEMEDDEPLDSSIIGEQSREYSPHSNQDGDPAKDLVE